MIPIPDDFALQSLESMPKMKPEAAQQCRLVAALRRSWQLLPDDWRPVIFAVPNGGQRDAREGANLKAQGVLAGVHDLCIVMREGRTIWIEMKAEDGSLSKSQIDIHKQFGALGHTQFTAYSAEEALCKLREILNGAV